ncbi:hypothetical protein [Pseudomonas sp. Gutcm_11s]|uniref:hypothetical protein n=1 Tax=Pseudomonas sp. Gutcm_11s TaxID=3026088 RepID=UPI002362EE9B|nr:hypothetical protein [Pseudomonas sp. Gutcm_11s]MDD0844141.1 hypothetical protein [Pseudomonas sp. Gutcm_11s]
MDRMQSLVFTVLLLAGLPAVAGEWPAGVRDTFQKGCVNSAGEALGQERAGLYCECTVKRIDRDFTTAELTALEKAELPDPLIKRLQQVSQQCLQTLGGQG